MHLLETLLKGVQVIFIGQRLQSLNRGDLTSLSLYGKNGTRFHGVTVHQDGTGTTK
jgi:hypothetical protein